MNFEHSDNLSKPVHVGRVLVVDDHAQLRQLLRTALEAGGFEVLDAATPGRAYQLAHTRPDALVLDLQHAETEGYQLLCRLRSRRELQDLPIVFIAGEQIDQLRWQVIRAGADWFFLRPLSMLELQDKIGELIEKGRPQLRLVVGRQPLLFHLRAS